MNSSFVQKIYEQVVAIKHNRKLEEHYMLFEELLAKRETRGIQKGIQKGRQEERVLISELIKKICDDNRSEDIQKLFADNTFFETMLGKYQIK